MKYLLKLLYVILFAITYLGFRSIVVYFNPEYPISTVGSNYIDNDFPVLLVKNNPNESDIKKFIVVEYCRVKDYKKDYKFIIDSKQVEKANEMLSKQKYSGIYGLKGKSSVKLIMQNNDGTQYLRIRGRWRDGICTITGWYIAKENGIIPKYVQYHSKSEYPSVICLPILFNLIFWLIIGELFQRKKRLQEKK
ncbi:MAG: hypothetical protein ACYC27_14495 [Armatimonadota bacterium]